MEFLVTTTIHVPEGTPPDEAEGVRAAEAARSRELAMKGHLRRMWRLPLQSGYRSIGLFAADDRSHLHWAPTVVTRPGRGSPPCPAKGRST